MEPSREELERRRQWFDWYVDQLASNSVRSPEGDAGPFRCPCCGCLTLDERGGYDVCPVCFWEDDGQDDHDANVVRGGPNGGLSLTQGRANYRGFGACEERFITRSGRPALRNCRSKAGPYNHQFWGLRPHHAKVSDALLLRQMHQANISPRQQDNKGNCQPQCPRFVTESPAYAGQRPGD